MPTWRFTGLEFSILWSAFGHDRLPYPLRFRPCAMDFDDLRRQREAAVEALWAKRYSHRLIGMLDILREPEVRIELVGYGDADTDDAGAPDIRRFHGAIRNDRAAVLVQLPGSDSRTGGDVLVATCAPEQVPARAVAVLPVEAAGTHESVRVHRADIAADRQYHVPRLNRIFKRPRRSMGEIRIHPGPAVDARPSFGRGFWWMDYPDGRYRVGTGNPITAEPVSTSDLVGEIARLTERTRRFHHEDLEHENYLRTRRIPASPDRG
ncbi:ESX secretion-associated protein EspG [Nocardia paucivorans]|uniref:ESX secretion-associated protein EspG n=1 Tax=Nocardia paucivorans TaxID=114259 RepID=UPI0002F8E962|nr:ESX secretion-associated protein EspG [Nocardia paucivorans]